MVNPAAGSGRCRQLSAAALGELRQRGVAFDVVETEAPQDAMRLARRAVAEGRRQFIAVGGDGTAFEIVNGIADQLGASDPRERVKLGFLPLGTGNSFLRDFGAGDARQAIEALAQSRARACDVLRLEHEAGSLHYLNLLSLGFVAEICAIANQRFKKMGASGYGLGVLVALTKLHSRLLRMQIDQGPTWEQAMVFLSVCNSRFTGGSMMMAPYADTCDGQADLIVCGAMDRLTLLSTFPKIFRGHHVFHHQISASRARSVEFFEPDPIDLMIDGEVVHHAPKRIDVRPAALDVFV
ncbi:MAG TPA: diacylglycerol kinase family protein [Polyangiales bacterium]|nr:diacylglycerol kinase family protein [Polyangiales bacterium]